MLVGRCRRDQGETRPLSPWIPSTPRKGQGLAGITGKREHVLAGLVDPNFVWHTGDLGSSPNEPIGMHRIGLVKRCLSHSSEFQVPSCQDIMGREVGDATVPMFVVVPVEILVTPLLGTFVILK